MNNSPILRIEPLGFPWQTIDPFLFCVHHLDHYPQGNATMGPAASLAGRNLGQDFAGKDGWSMYHGMTIPGFPAHPHRGFETVTYMLAGRMLHRDSAGHEGLLENGGVQWMTAGRGVIHSESPQQQEGLMEGFQLWLNLPAKNKMCAPWYRDIPSAALPEYEKGGVKVRVIAGNSNGVAGAVQREGTLPLYLDIHLAPGALFEQALPDLHNAFFYVYRGKLQSGGIEVPAGRMAIMANDAGSDGLRLQALDEPTRVILVAGRPLHEPIAQYGPFVMNTQAELQQAVRDFQNGKLA